MEIIIYLFAIAIVCLGTFFSLVGVLGYFRFPDVYSRLHTTGKVGVFGVVFLLIGAAVKEHAAWGHALVLIFFLMASSPVTSHAIASAAHRMGIKPNSSLRNDLEAFDLQQGEENLGANTPDNTPKG